MILIVYILSLLDHLQVEAKDPPVEESQCKVHEAITIITLALFLALSRSLIQLRAGDFSSCTSWTNNTIASIKALIRRAVIGAITDSCGCVYTQDLFDNEQLLCDQSRPMLAVYRAEIASTNMISSHDVVAIIEQWASESATYTEEVLIVTFDSTCPVRITSTNDPVCEMSSSNGGSNATITATVVVIILVFIAILIFVIGLAWWRYRHQHQ